MTLNIIVAVTENNAIGRNNDLLFHLKGDMKNFIRLTNDNIVIMGRKTYESIGKPLKNRINIVISRHNIPNKDIIVVDSLDMAIQKANEISIYMPKIKAYIIGGGSVYQEALKRNDIKGIYLTRINKEVENADTFFPKLDYYKLWEIKKVESYSEGYITYDICYISKKVN